MLSTQLKPKNIRAIIAVRKNLKLNSNGNFPANAAQQRQKLQYAVVAHLFVFFFLFIPLFAIITTFRKANKPNGITETRLCAAKL